jgi:hypothetical protein
MSLAMEEAKARLYGEGGLAVRDVKICPGSDRDAKPDAVARQIVEVLDRLERGDYEIVDNLDD